MQATGAHHFWGFTPPLDCQELHRALNAEGAGDEDAPLTVALVDVGDIRHVLKTVAQRRRHSKRPLKFVVMSRPAEGIARDLLLLNIALDWSVPLRQRAHALLEVWGNAMVPERTSKYIAKQRLSLIKLIAEDADAGFARRLLDFSLLKYRTRDAVQTVFGTWGHTVQYDMALLREYRLRHQYKDRYDFRANLMDWDYQFRVKPHTGIIHSKHFKGWRERGVAFEFGDSTYTNPNRSLASYVEGKEKGKSTLRRGFWGDVAVSPYHALGTTAYVGGGSVKGGCVSGVSFLPSATPVTHSTVLPPGHTKATAKERGAGLFTILNRHSGSEQRRHNAMEVGVFNLLSWLHEMETGTQYCMTADHGVYSGLGASPASPAPSTAAGAAEEDGGAAAARAARRARCISTTLSGVTLAPCSSDGLGVLLGKVAGRAAHPLHGAVDVLVLGSKAVHHLAGEEGQSTPPALLSLLAPGAVVVAETARNVVGLDGGQAGEFSRRVLGMGAAAGLAFAGPGRALVQDTYAAGSVVSTTGAAPAAAPASPAPPATAAFAYVKGEIMHHDARGGDNPPAEHLVFHNDASVREEVAAQWAKVAHLTAPAPGQSQSEVQKTPAEPTPATGAGEAKEAGK